MPQIVTWSKNSRKNKQMLKAIILN